MNTYLIVGKAFSGLTKRIIEDGDDYIVLRDRDTTKFPDKKLARRVVANFDSKEHVLEAIKPLRGKVNAVLTVYENYVLPTSWITEALDLPGLPVSSAEACTDKSLMRQSFAQASEKISPDFRTIDTWDEALEFANQHSYPLILKPANLAKSLLVTKSDDIKELEQNYQRTVTDIERLYKQYAPHRKPKILIEEYLIGSAHSVDAFVDHTGTPHVLGQVIDYETGFDIGYNDNFTYSRLLPSKLSVAMQEAVRATAAAGCRALGMKSSPAHVEIIVTAGGPRLIEIGARNGGYRERMHRLANDIDIPGNALRLALGKAPDITAKRHDPCAVLELFPKVPGIFKEITNQAAVETLPSLIYFAEKQTRGSFVGQSGDGYKMCAIIILHNSDTEQFEHDLAYVNEQVHVETTASK